VLCLGADGLSCDLIIDCILSGVDFLVDQETWLLFVHATHFDQIELLLAFLGLIHYLRLGSHFNLVT